MYKISCNRINLSNINGALKINSLWWKIPPKTLWRRFSSAYSIACNQLWVGDLCRRPFVRLGYHDIVIIFAPRLDIRMLFHNVWNHLIQFGEILGQVVEIFWDLSSRTHVGRRIENIKVKSKVNKDFPIGRRWCNGIMQDSHSCDPGSIPGRRITPYKARWSRGMILA